MSSFLGPLCSPELDALFWRPERLGFISAWWGHVPFAQWLVAAARPRSIVELGTHHGVSYCAFCEAVLRVGLETKCSAVDTWQGDFQTGFYDDDVFTELAAFHDARYGAFSNLIRAEFDSALDHFANGTIDLLHIDGMHTYEAISHDFYSWKPKLSEQAVVLFHDIEVTSGDFGVWRLWDELKSRYPNFSFVHSYGLGMLAVGGGVSSDIKELCSVADEGHVNLIRERFSRVGERWELDFTKTAAETARAKLEGALWEQVKRGDLLTGQVADLEKARSTLEGAVREQIKRGDLLTGQNEALNKAADTLRGQVADLEKARSTLEGAVREQIKRGDLLTEQNEALNKWANEMHKRNDDALDKFDEATKGLEQVKRENATLRERIERRWKS